MSAKAEKNYQTDNFKKFGAMADASYKKSVFHVERYQEKVLYKGHEIINHYDKLSKRNRTQKSGMAA